LLSLLSFILAIVMALGTALAADLTTYSIDLTQPSSLRLIELPFEKWVLEVRKDPFGEQALFFPRGSEAIRGPASAYGLRYFILNTPPIDNFELIVDVMGGAGEGENRSLAVIFGYQDLSNWWQTYLTYTANTRISSIVDERQINVCAPGVAELWQKNLTEYHQIKFTVTTDGDYKVFRTYLDGRPIAPIDNCRVPKSSYIPGKVGLGIQSASTVQAQYYKNIKLTVLP
jgi:hypothetical protein